MRVDQLPEQLRKQLDQIWAATRRLDETTRAHGEDLASVKTKVATTEKDVTDLASTAASPVAASLQPVSITAVVETALPAAGGGEDGRVYLDTTNGRLIYYVNGVRYKLSGTSF